MLDTCDDRSTAITTSPSAPRPISKDQPDNTTTLTFTLTPLHKQVAVGFLAAVGVFAFCWMAARAFSATPRPARVQPVQAAPIQSAPIEPAPTQSPDLTARVAALEQELAIAKKKLDADANSIFFLFSQSELRNQPVSLDLASQGFQRVNSGAGFFLVSVRGAQPYLDGYKVVLGIGNPTCAIYEGIKISASWGPRGRLDNPGFFSKGRKLDVGFAGRLEPGRWNDIEFVLPSTQPHELGEFRVAIETEMVTLLSPRR